MNATTSLAARLRREPLVHFALGALALLAAERAHRALRPAAPSRPAVIVDDAFVAGLRARQAMLLGRAVTDDEARSLVREWVREEVLYREGVALGLADGDAIVRRRVVQKMEFALAARVHVATPDDRTLDAWRSAHMDRWREPARVTLTHALYTRDLRGDRTVNEARAELARALADAQFTPRGDPFVGGAHLESRSERDLATVFGDEGARAVMALPTGLWQGPIAGPFGAHLVRVEARFEGRVPALGEVRDAVLRDWTAHARDEALRAEIDRRLARWTVQRIAGSSAR